MKIAFEGQLLLAEKKTGIAWNAHNLILELAKNPENECTIQVFGLVESDEELHRLDVYKEAGCKIEVCRWFSFKLYKLLWAFLPVPYHWFFKTEADVTQFFNFVIPPGVRGKAVTIVHDMAYKACPETVTKRTKTWLDLTMKRTCKRAFHIVTVSEFSKQEIHKYLGVPLEKITVIPNAVDHDTFHPNYTEEQVQSVREKYGLKDGYFLYLGTIEPRKNLEHLIGAYEKFCDSCDNPPQLVLAGGKGWLCEGIYEKAEKSKYTKNILFTGYIDQEDAPVLMKGAKAFVFPSLYEGFGMPPLEAMACGTPVIVSDQASLPEVVGEAGLIAKYDDEDDIAEKMNCIYKDAKLRDGLVEAGVSQAVEFTWYSGAKKLKKIYKEIQE